MADEIARATALVAFWRQQADELKARVDSQSAGYGKAWLLACASQLQAVLEPPREEVLAVAIMAGLAEQEQSGRSEVERLAWLRAKLASSER